MKSHNLKTYLELYYLPDLFLTNYDSSLVLLLFHNRYTCIHRTSVPYIADITLNPAVTFISEKFNQQYIYYIAMQTFLRCT
jgi:hypothetical protein